MSFLPLKEVEEEKIYMNYYYEHGLGRFVPFIIYPSIYYHSSGHYLFVDHLSIVHSPTQHPFTHLSIIHYLPINHHPSMHHQPSIHPSTQCSQLFCKVSYLFSTKDEKLRLTQVKHYVHLAG